MREVVEQMRSIIDCHVHIYPDKIAEKASKSIGEFYDMPMRFDGRTETLKSICEQNKIKVCVINSVATTPQQVVSINNFISDSVKSAENSGTVRFHGLLTLHADMTETEIADEIERTQKLGLFGIKLHPDFQKFSIDDRKVYKLYEAAEGRMPILFHTGDRRFSFSNPQRLAKVTNDFPNLTAVGAHFGGWSEWDEGIRSLASKENVYVDTSSSFYSMTRRQALDTIRAFGAERVMFGSDYPMWDAGRELEFFGGLDLTPDEREMILFGNSKKLFALHCC